MKYADAIAIIDQPVAAKPPGYMVAFEHVEGCLVRGDHFPDKHAGELLIESESVAWELARAFAARTRGRCVNIYVIGSDFVPVDGYETKKIPNRF